jgi:hypothetical protein
MEPSQNPQPVQETKLPENRLIRLRRFLNEYAWFILRNVIGWILILTSPVLGAVFPGPGGLPVFLIGFALVTFPGKRRLTARVLRGRRLRIEDRAYAFLAGFISILIPGMALWLLAFRLKYEERLRHLVETYAPKRSVWVLSVMIAVGVTWLVTRISLKILNGLLRLLPRFRRRFRPWLRKKGLKLLPPRHRQAPEEPLPPDEILELDPKQRRRFTMIWRRAKPWLRRIAAVGVTVWIFVIMIRPLRQHWPEVRHDIATLSPWRFLLASAMFSLFLLCFRAFSWRRVLKGFGYKLPYAASARIYITSEMARYLPLGIWQVVGRVFLCKPYGVPGTIVSTSQILEICVFLFANILIAGLSFLWFGQKVDPHARPWLITAMALVPGLGLILHPAIFYKIANRILERLGKPPIVKRLRGKKLIALLGWMILGLLWQSVAVYVLVDPVLHFKADWWWVVAGAYCVAWCCGFLAFWAPGGFGVREVVFVLAMQMFLPAEARSHFPDPAALKGVLVLLGFLLRLWTIVGELMLLAVTFLWDFRGATNDPNAPGRVKMSPADLTESAEQPPPAPLSAAVATAGSTPDESS